MGCLLLQVACNGGADGPDATPGADASPAATVPAEATPAGPAPTVSGVQNAPPSAWISTEAGSFWLAVGGYCWKGTCLDPMPPESRSDVPSVDVARGSTVRFHLEFAPSQLVLAVDAQSYPLQAARVAEWRVEGSSGVAQLSAEGADGSAQYIARLNVR